MHYADTLLSDTLIMSGNAGEQMFARYAPLIESNEKGPLWAHPQTPSVQTTFLVSN